MDKPFQESYEDIGGKFPLDNHESKDATRGDSRDHIAAEAGSGCGNDGCFAANSPCLARMKVGTHSCLVTKENVRLMLARQEHESSETPLLPTSQHVRGLVEKHAKAVSEG